MNFESLGLSVKLVNALKNKMNITSPTKVQEEAIPIALAGQHIMAQSKTGTGKTLAFILPIIEKLTPGKNNEALILLPTRELARQVNEVVEDLDIEGVTSWPIYGGVSLTPQIKKLEQGISIVVGTPGRIIDLYKRRKLDLRNIKTVVLDEGDRLWDMGFAPDIKFLLNQIKTKFQFLLFSATLEYDIRELVKKYSGNKFNFLDISKDDLTVGSTRQFYYMIDFYENKFKTFKIILRKEKPQYALVFVNTKKTATWLSNKLRYDKNLGFKVGIISGSLSQAQREKILSQFKSRQITMLIATDVAARGLDIDNITHVINYDIPKYPEVYVHRIGRTSRMSKKGTAISLVVQDEYEHLCHIEGLINKEIKQKTLREQNQRRQSFPFY